MLEVDSSISSKSLQWSSIPRHKLALWGHNDYLQNGPNWDFIYIMTPLSYYF